jgi:hypothetical protein
MKVGEIGRALHELGADPTLYQSMDAQKIDSEVGG